MTHDPADRATQAGFWKPQETERLARALRLARRHSRLVRVLRGVIPVAFLLGVGSLAVISFVSKVRLPPLPIITGISGTHITMEVPHIGGFTRDGRAYQVSAVAAAQDLTKPDILELSGIRGKMVTKEKAEVAITSAAGLYDIKSQLLTLTRDVEVTTSDGKHALLSEAQIETEKGHIVSNKPVKIDFPDGDLRANAIELINSGEVVHFTGAVVLNTSRGAAKPGGAATAGPKPGTLGPPGSQQAPIRIKSNTLEMRDHDHLATFAGGVFVVQGDSTLKCDALKVEYQSVMGASNDGQQIRHLDGTGHVILTQNDQVATGDSLSFDAKTNTAILLGNVSITQGQNLVRGDKLTLDLTTGEARVDMLDNKDNKGAHVESVFYPHSDNPPPVAPKPRSHAAPPAPGALALHAH
jgi:lipopolysaccharide export system protein LptC